MVADVTPSTASVHLNRLRDEHLVKVMAQGKHRYYSLAGSDVADVLESLSVLAGRPKFKPRTPERLRAARTCYDHIAGSLGVALHDAMRRKHWIDESYQVTETGEQMFGALGIDVERTRGLRRRLAFGCLDWSERRSHLGGALGAALLKTAIARRWVVPGLDSRALSITRTGCREMNARFGLELS